MLLHRTYTPAVNDAYLNSCTYKSTHILHKIKILTIPITYKSYISKPTPYITTSTFTIHHTIYIYTAKCLLSKNDFSFLLNSSEFLNSLNNSVNQNCVEFPRDLFWVRLVFYCRNLFRVRVMKNIWYCRKDGYLQGPDWILMLVH